MCRRLNRPSLTLVLIASMATANFRPANAAEIACHFSPDGGTAAAIVARISRATQSIDVAAYQLTDPRLISAIIAAASRGVRTRVIVAAEMESPGYNRPTALHYAGVPARCDRMEKLFHNKYAVIDGIHTITGSFNWTANADNRNAENAVIITEPSTAAAFAADFQRHWNHSRPYDPSRAMPNRLPAPRDRSLSLHPARDKKELLLWHALPAP